MADIAGVTPRGYYKWLEAQEKREEKENKDRADFELILEAYQYKGYAKGARSIHMRLLHRDEPVIMNVKKIKRLMSKYNLRCPIRRPNPAKISLNINIGNRMPENILDRRFREFGPRMVFLTDITYLLYDKGSRRCYLSTVKDAYTKQILAYATSINLKEEFVINTFRQLIFKHGQTIPSNAIVHSDQGLHYRTIEFCKLLEDKGFIQSMSRRATCWDNAPQESFFGHMKDEIDISKCKTYEEVVKIIDSYMQYYNESRYQWGLAKLSPNEYYQYTQTGEYSIITGKDKAKK